MLGWGLDGGRGRCTSSSSTTCRSSSWSASLFVISGGIVITGPFRGTPRSNAALLLAGTVCASAIGTTGASMLFIRPLLRANEHRRHRAHTVVFFIFLVVEHRRKPDAARRSAAVPRVPARGRVLLDDVAPAPSDGVPDGRAARASTSCIDAWLARRERAGGGRGPGRARERPRADPRRGRVQPDPARRGRGRRCSRPGAFATRPAVPGCRRLARSRSRSAPFTCRSCRSSRRRRAHRARRRLARSGRRARSASRTNSRGRRSRRSRSSSSASS